MENGESGVRAGAWWRKGADLGFEIAYSRFQEGTGKGRLGLRCARRRHVQPGVKVPPSSAARPLEYGTKVTHGKT